MRSGGLRSFGWREGPADQDRTPSGMTLKPVREERALVLFGHFNPAIFHPAWFAAEGLIRKSESEQATAEVVHEDVAQIDFVGYKLLVTRDQFQLATEQSPYFRVIADLTQGIFQLLQHTPLRAAGYVAIEDYRLEDEGQWERLSEFLAPTQAVWADLFAEPKLQTLRMQSTTPLGHTQVSVSPLESRGAPAFRVVVVDHFDSPADGLGKGARGMLDTLMANKSQSEERCQQVFEKLTTLARSKS